MRRLAAAVVAAAVFVGSDLELTYSQSHTSIQDLTPPALPARLVARLDPVIDALWSGFSRRMAMRHVQFISQYWRLAGNPGFNATINRVKGRLLESGFKERSSTPQVFHTAPATSSTWVETYANTGKGWSYSVGTVAVVRPGKPDQIVLSRELQHVALSINSFSTPAGGVVAPLVDVGSGDKDEDYTRVDLKGAVVLGDADSSRLWQRGVVGGGAIGVISTNIGRYVTPDRPGARPTPRDQWNILQWGSVPYDEARKGFGFKATPRAAATLRAALAEGEDVRVRVTIASTFSSSPTRTLVAEIPGRVAPDERIVLVAHVQEPGANDNASGVATLTELARALRLGIGSGTIPQPDRTLTLLWGEEVAASRQWLRDHPEEAKDVRYMFSMDMTGEDVHQTGGSFLIERYPDPAAVWERPWDPHTEWGKGNVRENQLKGDLINDLHLAICGLVARRSQWIVRTNPYEGGSDHTTFGNAGVPAVLDWHFTDRYYHTNLDTPDKTSASEMRNVGVAVAASAWLLASSHELSSLSVADLVARAGRTRLAIEEREGAKLAAADADPAAAAAREKTIVAAWRKWYGEAVRSVSRLIVGTPSSDFAKRVELLAASFDTPASAPAAGAPNASAPMAQPATPAPAGPTVEAVQLALDRLSVDRMYPESSVPKAQHDKDLATLQAGLASSSPAVRRAAVRGLGRFENPAEVPRIAAFLTDANAGVRLEASNAVAQAVTRARGADVMPALAVLEAHHTGCEALARLRYDRATATRVLPAIAGLSGAAQPGETLMAEVVSCVALVLRQNQGLAIDDRLRHALRNTVKPPASGGTPNAEALDALGLAADDDRGLVEWASSYSCGSGKPAECGWEMRYAAVQRTAAADPAQRALLDRARHDAAFQVRLAALRKLAAPAGQTKTCAALADAFVDTREMTIVRLEAATLIDARCTERDSLVPILAAQATRVGDPASRTEWHVPARALEALARVAPDQAATPLAAAAMYAVWQVRTAAARAAGTVKDEALLAQLAGDPEANVRTEAIDALVRLKSPGAVTAALAALSSDTREVALIRAAANALKGDTDRPTFWPPLFAALARLTAEGKDTSRDARVAILDRLKASAAPAEKLQPYLRDSDPVIAAAAADAIAATTGARPNPAPTYRAPEQPTDAELRALPAHATIELAGGARIPMELLTADAPLSVWRFLRDARAGAYNGLTFHRVEALFVIQGGSPGANEYSGGPRFGRDEIGPPRHTRGAVGLSTRGHDTADGQIFIDLLDWPRLNYLYTVFAHVPESGMAPADHVLEGAAIVRITIER